MLQGGLEGGCVGAGHGEARDGDARVECSDEVRCGCLQGVVKAIFDVETRGARLAPRRIERARGEVEPSDAWPAGGEVAAGAAGAAGDVHHGETGDVSQGSVEDGHLALIPVAVERVTRPVAARQPLIDVGLQIPILGTVVEAHLGGAVPQHFDERPAAHHHAVSIRMACAAAVARAAASSRSPPLARTWPARLEPSVNGWTVLPGSTYTSAATTPGMARAVASPSTRTTWPGWAMMNRPMAPPWSGASGPASSQADTPRATPRILRKSDTPEASSVTSGSRPPPRRYAVSTSLAPLGPSLSCVYDGPRRMPSARIPASAAAIASFSEAGGRPEGYHSAKVMPGGSG